MKRNFSFDDIISGRSLQPRKRLRASFSNKLPSSFWSGQHRRIQNLSALNQKALHEFTNFIHIENTTNHISIYKLLLLDAMILKPSLFCSENWNGTLLCEWALNAGKNVPEIERSVQQRLGTLFSENVAQVGNKRWGFDMGATGGTVDDIKSEPNLKANINISDTRIAAQVHSINGSYFVKVGNAKYVSNSDIQTRRELKVNGEYGRTESTRNLNISFFETLQIVSIITKFSNRRRRYFIQHWGKVLPFLYNWRLALELHSAVKVSTLATYFSQLRVFVKFCTNPLHPTEMLRHDMSHVLFDIANNLFSWETIHSYLHTRTYAVHFRTVRSSFSALSFFYRHLTGHSIWEVFPKLRDSMKHLQKTFLDIEHSGSVALTMQQLTEFLDFILESYSSDYIATAVLYNLIILSFWGMLRISEACHLLDSHILKFLDPDTDVKKLRMTLMHTKTSSIQHPDQFVILGQLKDHDLDPYEALERLQALKAENCNHIFFDQRDKPLTSTKLQKAFKEAVKAWQEQSNIAPSGTITFHSLRISAIGFQAIELGLSIYEIQCISRHKFGSDVTEQIYLARNKQHLLDAVASKITKLVPIVGTDPGSTSTPSWMDNLPIFTRRLFASWKN